MQNNEETVEEFTITTDVELNTGGGQFLSVTCRPEDADKIKDFFKSVKRVEIPDAKTVTLGHGAYGAYSRYQIVQHKYVGAGYPGNGGFIEVLEIKNPPENRCGTIINVLGNNGYFFYEFRSLESAIKAYDGEKISFFDGAVPKDPTGIGLIRKVVCGWFDPWFYAVANQALFGDFVFPNTIGIDHPIFRFGKKFVVADYAGHKEIKTCIAVSEEEEERYSDGKKQKYLIVWWNDGTYWSESSDFFNRPRFLEEKDLWIQDAIDAFRKVLSGEISEFSVNTNRAKIAVKVDTQSRNKSNIRIKSKKAKGATKSRVIVTNTEEWPGVLASPLMET